MTPSRYWVAPLLALLFVAFAPVPADAGLMLRLERISDTEAVLSGTGSVDDFGTTVFDQLEFVGATTGSPAGAGSVVGDFGIGSFLPTEFFEGVGSLVISEAAGSTGTFTSGDMPVGSSQLARITGGFIFGPVGTTGNLVAQIAGGTVNDVETVGSYQIVATSAPVPEPSTMVMAVAGAVAGLCGSRRRKQDPSKG